MKIIELFNKIANGEDVPKKIEYKDWLYDWNESSKDYKCGNDWLEERIYNDFETFLNDEVEIIEEDKKENEIPNINLDNMKEIGTKVGKACRELFEGLNKGWNTLLEENKEIEKIDIKSDEATPNSYYILNEHGTKCYLTKHSKIIADKINKLIDKLNSLEKKR